MSEQYPAPDLNKIALAGTVFMVVPQRFSIYRADTFTVLHTLPKYRDAMLEVQRRLENAT